MSTQTTDLAAFDDPAFRTKANALIAAEQQRFDDWLATDSFDALIDEALAAGLNAYGAALARADTSGLADFGNLAAIALDHRRARPLVQALRLRRIGRIDLISYSYDISAQDIVDDPGQHGDADAAAVESFAVALSKPGFEIAILRQART